MPRELPTTQDVPGEETPSELSRVLAEYPNGLQPTDASDIFFSPLPIHWRVKKAFPKPFRVVCLSGNIPDGTVVSVSAGNGWCPNAELRNNSCMMKGSVATFEDFRFDSKSGRNMSFCLTITIHTAPQRVATCRNIIKISLNGPQGKKKVSDETQTSVEPAETGDATSKKKSRRSVASNKENLPQSNTTLTSEESSSTPLRKAEADLLRDRNIESPEMSTGNAEPIELFPTSNIPSAPIQQASPSTDQHLRYEFRITQAMIPTVRGDLDLKEDLDAYDGAP